MKDSKKTSKVLPVCMTIMAVCNFIAGMLALPSGLGVFMIVTAAICTLGAILSWRAYSRRHAPKDIAE